MIRGIIKLETIRTEHSFLTFRGHRKRVNNIGLFGPDLYELCRQTTSNYQYFNHYALSKFITLSRRSRKYENLWTDEGASSIPLQIAQLKLEFASNCLKRGRIERRDMAIAMLPMHQHTSNFVISQKCAVSLCLVCGHQAMVITVIY